MADEFPEIEGYEVLGLLGHGGMGSVYRARHLGLDRVVALKVIHPHLAQDESFGERFRREMKLAASIEHPYVVAVYEAGGSPGRPFIAMRLIPGGTLTELIANEGPLDPLWAVSLVEQVASALDYAHEMGVIHRDVKPGNILIGEKGRHAYLGDFGIAKALEATTAYTKTGHWVGAIRYASPEQIEGKDVDARSDVYSLGCVLYEALTGKPAFGDGSDASIMMAKFQEEWRLPTEDVPKLNPGFDGLIKSAWAIDPKKRPQSATELTDKARSLLTGSGAETVVMSDPSQEPTRVIGGGKGQAKSGAGSKGGTKKKAASRGSSARKGQAKSGAGSKGGTKKKAASRGSSARKGQAKSGAGSKGGTKKKAAGGGSSARKGQAKSGAGAKEEEGSAVVGCLVFIAIGLVVLGALGFFLFRTDKVEAELKAVDLPQDLVLAGQDSRYFPDDVTLESLRSYKPTGFKLIARALRDGDIESFKDVLPKGFNRTSKFELNGSSKAITFGPGLLDIESLRGNRTLSRDLSVLAFEIYDYEAGDREWEAINAREDEAAAAEPDAITFGSPIPDLASEWQGIAESWRDWLATYGDAVFPEAKKLARLYEKFTADKAELYSNPTQSTLDTSNASVDTVNSLGSDLLKENNKKRKGRLLE